MLSNIIIHVSVDHSAQQAVCIAHEKIQRFELSTYRQMDLTRARLVIEEQAVE